MNKVNLETDNENIVFMNLKDGIVVIELLPELAPKHVKRIKNLIHKKFYDGLTFHRVVKDFVVQTGDPTGTGSGGSGYIIKDEISGAHHVKGMVSMANKGPNTEDSQIFITLTNALWLDDKHTIIGRVMSGMEHVYKINNGGTPSGKVPAGYGNPDKIISMKLASKINVADYLTEVEDTGPKFKEYMGYSIHENINGDKEIIASEYIDTQVDDYLF
ncbi:MAG: peptidylprolyl isomerase [Sphingobacteriia bacterium]|nr:peptidylprolyl isomerase [Sphingobacteriia bacterium]